MKSDWYLRLAAEWAVRARLGILRCVTGWERAAGTGIGGDTGMGIIAGRDRGSTLVSGASLGSGTTLDSGAAIGKRDTLGGGITLGSD